MKQKIKQYWKSKTFWVNTLLVLAGVFTSIAGEIQSGGTITAIGVINIILRFVTKEQIR